MYFTDGGSIIKVINIMDDKYVQYPDIDNPLLDEEGNILNPNSIDIIPNAVLHPFVIRNLVKGNFKAGVAQYCYRLYNPHSQQTSLSSLSKTVHLAESDSSSRLEDYYGSSKVALLVKELYYQRLQILKTLLVVLLYVSSMKIMILLLHIL